MANSKKKITLQEALDFVLNSDTEYNEELSSDEETDEENDPCYRISINSVDSDDPDKILTLVSIQHNFFLPVLPSYPCILSGLIA